MDEVEFSKEAIKNYLDTAIRRWRKSADSIEVGYAQYYIDAFQSVRVSLFGELLPLDK